MTDIDPILDAIDHCLEDWSVSPDAMRWTPQPTAGMPMVLDEAHLLWVAPVGTPPTGIRIPGDVEYVPPTVSQWQRLGYTTTPIELRYEDDNNAWTDGTP